MWDYIDRHKRRAIRGTEGRHLMYRTAIFDLDGTLLDTIGDLAVATNHALEAFGMPTRTLEQTRASVGNGIRRLVERSVPEGTTQDVVDQVTDEFKAFYAENCNVLTKPYDGILDMLANLRAAGVRCAISSNKGDFAVQTLAKQYFDGLVDIAVGEREGVPRKPSPESILGIMEQLEADPKSTVYVGDSDVDIMTAANVGVPCISCSWGFRDTPFLLESGATTIVDDAAALEQAILA